MSTQVGAKAPEAHAVEAYRRDGFVRVEGVFSRDEVDRWHAAALAMERRERARATGGTTFTQLVNVWQRDETLAALTLDSRLGRLATALSGIPMRLWHDHLLIKQPGRSTPTEFHQDAPYWPHLGCRHALSVWIALCDVPPERGCMTFLPRSHDLGQLPRQDHDDPESLFSICPELRFFPRVMAPLRAGDVTIHNSCCAHGATANTTSDPRVAHVVLFMDAETRYRRMPHVVTDGLGLDDGAPLDGETFPLADV